MQAKIQLLFCSAMAALAVACATPGDPGPANHPGEVSDTAPPSPAPPKDTETIPTLTPGASAAQREGAPRKERAEVAPEGTEALPTLTPGASAAPDTFALELQTATQVPTQKPAPPRRDTPVVTTPTPNGRVKMKRAPRHARRRPPARRSQAQAGSPSPLAQSDSHGLHLENPRSLRRQTVKKSSSMRAGSAPAQRSGAHRRRPSHATATMPSPQPPPSSREQYAHNREQTLVAVKDEPLSTFAADVDTASYSNLRRILQEGRLPPVDAVRIEEMINYFDYPYPEPTGASPFGIHTEVGPCPWNKQRKLVHIGLRTRNIEDGALPPRNLVFLLDVSGSMRSPDKLPLLQRGLSMLTNTLRPEDHVAIVVYAGASGMVLPPTSGSDRGAILAALQKLRAGGSTNGAAGIKQAYQVARQQFRKEGINRVILASDGDFNVGMSSIGALTRLIEKERESGVFLTVLGFGRGNLQDATMESLADHGNGNYAYIDSISEAHKVLVREAGATLVTVAKDVKLQVEWNPARVSSYRLVGYLNRRLAARDFDDDKKDAGEVGAGHSVTALYEIVPAGQAGAAPATTPALRYQQPLGHTEAATSEELFTLKIRHKKPDAKKSTLQRFAVLDREAALASTSDAFRFSASVAGFGLLLRKSRQATISLGELRALAAGALGSDPQGDRREMLRLVDVAGSLAGSPLARAR